MHSLLGRTTGLAGLHLLAPAEGLSARATRWIQSRCDRVGLPLSMHRVDGTFGSDYKCPQKHLTVVSLYRLLLPDLLPNLERVVYMDSDVIVADDIASIWGEAADNVALAAARDCWFPTMQAAAMDRPARVALGFRGPSPYFNAGVMVANLAYWRANRITPRAVDMLWSHAPQLDMADQDALNLTISGAWTELDPRWNVQVAALRRIHEFTDPFQRQIQRLSPKLRARPGVMHYTGPFKPWNPPVGLRNIGRARFSAALLSSGYLGPGEHAQRITSSTAAIARRAAGRVAALFTPRQPAPASKA